MKDRFRLAIVGCGRISASHAEAALTSPMTTLGALVDPVRERCEALAARFDVQPTITTNIEEVAATVDGAIIATPNHLHAALAEQCLAAGLAVLIEKPLALTVAEGERICEAGRRAGRTVAVGYVTRFRENVRLMAALIQDGYFGQIRRFAYQFGTRGGWAPLSAYNLDRRTSGGGVLVVTGTHFIDRMLYWFGYPDDASLLDDSVGGPEANAVMQVRYGTSPSVVGTARFSKATAMPAGFVMETERGTVVLGDRDDSPVEFFPADQPTIRTVISTRVPVHGDPFVRQVEDFVVACRDAHPPAVSGEQGLTSLKLIEQLYGHRHPMTSEWYDPSAFRSAS